MHFSFTSPSALPSPKDFFIPPKTYQVMFLSLFQSFTWSQRGYPSGQLEMISKLLRAVLLRDWDPAPFVCHWNFLVQSNCTQQYKMFPKDFVDLYVENMYIFSLSMWLIYMWVFFFFLVKRCSWRRLKATFTSSAKVVLYVSPLWRIWYRESCVSVLGNLILALCRACTG